MHSFVDPDLDSTVVVKLLEDIDIFITAACVLYLGPTEFDVTLHAKNNGAFSVFSRSGWNATPDQTLRRIQQHAVWLTVLFVFRYLTTKRVRGVLVDTSKLQRSTVRNCNVTVSSSENDWIVWSDLVEVPTRWKDGRRP